MRKVMMMLITTLLLGAGANAQSGGEFDLSWWTIDGGGVTFATGGIFRLDGTLGQPDASNTLTGGEFSLTGGFLFTPGYGTTNGDVTRDGCVDDADLLAVLFAFGGTGFSPEDVNCDWVVDDADLLIVLFNFGNGC